MKDYPTKSGVLDASSQCRNEKQQLRRFLAGKLGGSPQIFRIDALDLAERQVFNTNTKRVGERERERTTIYI
jgi:hypothetical protein